MRSKDWASELGIKSTRPLGSIFGWPVPRAEGRARLTGTYRKAIDQKQSEGAD
jgi:hypothetical protein